MQLKNTYLFNIYGVRSFLFTAVCVFKKKKNSGEHFDK